MKKQTFKLTNLNGLGSRASTTLVSEANKFESDLVIRYNKECANLKSIMNVMALVIRQNEMFEIEVNGKDEIIAFESIINLLKNLQLI